MENLNMNKLLEQERERLGDLVEEKEELQEIMATPTELNEIGDEIKKLTEEIKALEDIVDFANDNKTFESGLSYNAREYQQYLRDNNSESSINEKLDTITGLESRLTREYEKENADNQDADNENPSSETTENPYHNRDNMGDQDTGTSFLDDLD